MPEIQDKPSCHKIGSNDIIPDKFIDLRREHKGNCDSNGKLGSQTPIERPK